MQITFLGTGTSQGIPVIGCGCKVCTSGDPRDHRLRTALMIEQGDDCIVIDTGPDFREQMLRNKVKNLSGVLITHEHNDHIAGLDDLRSFNFMSKQPVHIYTESRVRKVLYQQFPYIFETVKYPGTPNLVIHELSERSFNIGAMHIEPIRLYHYNLPVLGFRTGNIAYLTDVSYIPAEEMLKLQNLEYLIIDALRIKPHISHFNLQQALEIVNRLKPKYAKFIHISHQLGKHAQVKADLPKHIEPAYDGMTIHC